VVRLIQEIGPGSSKNGGDFSDPSELGDDTKKNYGGIQPQDGEGVALDGYDQFQELIGELYRYDLEDGSIYYLHDLKTGKRFLLDYEPFSKEQPETPKSERSMEI